MNFVKKKKKKKKKGYFEKTLFNFINHNEFVKNSLFELY